VFEDPCTVPSLTLRFRPRTGNFSTEVTPQMNPTRNTIPILVGNAASDPVSLACEPPKGSAKRVARSEIGHPEFTIAQNLATRVGSQG